MEFSKEKKFEIEDNDFFIQSGSITIKEWREIIAGGLRFLKKAIVNIQSTDTFMQSDNNSLEYISFTTSTPFRIRNITSKITPTFLGEYLKIVYCFHLEGKTPSDKTYVYITTIHDRPTGKLINGCHIMVSKDCVTLGEVYIDLTTEQISGDIIFRLGNIKDDILLEHTKLKYGTLKDKINNETSVILSSIGVKYNSSLNNQIRDTVYEYNEAISNKLKQLLSETERKYADYFIANDPLNIMLDDMADGLGLSTMVIAGKDTTNM